VAHERGGAERRPVQYLMLIQIDEAAFAPKQTLDLLAAQKRWGRALSGDGAVLAGDRLHPPPTARTVRRTGGRTMCIDGPFVETKEHLGGYYLVELPDESKALEQAAAMPVGALCPVFTVAIDSARLLPRDGERPSDQTMMVFYGPPPKVAPVHPDLRSWVRIDPGAAVHAATAGARPLQPPTAVALVDGGLDGAQAIAEIAVPEGGAVELRPVVLGH